MEGKSELNGAGFFMAITWFSFDTAAFARGNVAYLGKYRT